MKTLVTGGAGFIGSHLVERLLGDGHEVIVLDNFAGGNQARLEHLKHYQRLAIQAADVTSFEDCQPLVSGVRWVFHLAGLADIVPSVEDPLKYHRANVDGTATILEAARLAGVERFIYSASSSCYGIPDEYPTPETASIRPMYPYALTKYLGEQCALHWHQVYGLPTVSLRLFNVYGPRSRTSGAYGAVFGVFLAQKLAGKALTVVGDGNQTRDFTFVTDVVEAMIRAAESDVAGEVFNVGSGNTYSINHLVSLLGGETVRMPKRPGEPDCTFADIGKIRRMLDWSPSISFEQGVQVLIDQIDYWRDAPLWSSTQISEMTKDWFRYLGPSQKEETSTRYGD